MAQARTRSSGLLILALLLIVSAGAYLYVAQANRLWPFRLKPELPPAGQRFDLAVWEWRSPSDFSRSDVRDYIEDAKAAGIRTVYIDVSEYIDIRETLDSEKAA